MFIASGILIDALLRNFLVFIFLTHDSWFLKLPYRITVFLLVGFLAGDCLLFVATKL